MTISLIDGRWNSTNDYTVTNGVLTSKSTIGSRFLGEGKFYFEITNTTATTNRWIGVTSKIDPAWVSYGNMVGTFRNSVSLTSLTANAVYGFHLDLTSTEKGRLRYNNNGGVFSNWFDIVDYAGNTFNEIKPAIGSSSSSNGETSFFINTGQTKFYNDIKELSNDKEFIDTYFFDGSGSINAHKILLQSNNKTYSLDSIDTVYETKMTSNTSTSPFVASASSEFTSTYPAWKAFNGTNSGGNYDYWSSVAGTTGWIQINYGKRVHANILELSSTMLTQQVADGMPRDFNILASNDNSKFIKLAEYKEQTWVNGETKKYKFRNNIAYQYYRIEAFSTNGYGYVCIGEILFKSIQNIAIEIPKTNVNNFINYGMFDLKNLNRVNENKNYILQDKVSRNSDGMLTTKLDRKPLSISFK